MVKHFQEKTITQQVLDGIECDKCHKFYKIDNIFEIQEFHHINFNGGYGSIFGDGDKIQCDICQYCLKEMIGDFCKRTSQYY